MKQKLLLLLTICLLSLNSIADTGCRIIYQAGTPSEFWRVFPSYPSASTNYIVYNSSAQCAGQPSTVQYILRGELAVTGTACSVTGQGSGRVATYPRYYNCSLDNYITWLILTIGIFSFFLIRRKSLLVS